MRILMFVFVFMFCVASIASIASAELLTTANPIGQGNWAVLGAGLQDSNVSNMSNWGATSLCGYMGYGLTEQLDIFVSLGSTNVTGLPATMTLLTGTGVGVNLKYLILAESDTMPFSVAGGVGYKALSQRMQAGLAVKNTNGSQVGGAVGISKLIIPFIPYTAVTYKSTSGNIGDSSQIDLTAGSAIAWSEQAAAYLEYTLQSLTSGGTTYSSGQVGLGVGYRI